MPASFRFFLPSASINRHLLTRPTVRRRGRRRVDRLERHAAVLVVPGQRLVGHLNQRSAISVKPTSAMHSLMISKAVKAGRA